MNLIKIRNAELILKTKHTIETVESLGRSLNTNNAKEYPYSEELEIFVTFLGKIIEDL